MAKIYSIPGPKNTRTSIFEQLAKSRHKRLQMQAIQGMVMHPKHLYSATETAEIQSQLGEIIIQLNKLDQNLYAAKNFLEESLKLQSRKNESVCLD